MRVCWPAFLFLFCNCLPAFAQKPASVDDVLAAYIKAVGGLEAVERVNSREVHTAGRTYYWLKPNKVLMTSKNERTGFDGSTGWTSEKKRGAKRLAHNAELPLEMDANPLRYVHLKSLYPDVEAAPPETLDGEPMDVLVCANSIGQTKFYFDAASHLLRRIEETGETSAYFKTTTEFRDYRELAGLSLPYRILRTTTEPGGKKEDLRVKEIIENPALKPEIFSKPNVVAGVHGAKH